MSSFHNQKDTYKKETAQSNDYKDAEFKYWLLLVLTIIVIPSLVWLYRRVKRSKTKLESKCNCAGCLKKLKEKQTKQDDEYKSISTVLKMTAVIFLTIFYGFLLYNVITTATIQKEPYNPYKVLEIPDGSSPAEIKKAYRQLSLKYHPDKNPDAGDIFIAISKAYEALTDEAVREKLEKYGNPDGPQPISVSIALPSFLIDKNNSMLVLSGYLALLVIALPSIVYLWHRSNKGDNQKPNDDTMKIFYHFMTPQIKTMKQVAEIVSLSKEFESLPERFTDEEDIKILAKNIHPDHKIKKTNYKPYINKGIHLLFTHFSRTHQHLSPKLKEDFDFYLKKHRLLINAAFQITAYKKQFQPIIEVIRFSQCMYQAVWEDQPFKQLPHVNGHIIDHLKRNRINDLFKLKSETKERRSEIFKSYGELSDRDITDIENILAEIPVQVGITYRVFMEENSTEMLNYAVLTLEITFHNKFESPELIKPKRHGASSSSSSSSSKKIIQKKPKRIFKKKSFTTSPSDRVTSEGESEDETNDTTSTANETNDNSKDKEDSDSDLSDEDISDSDSDDDWTPQPKNKLTFGDTKEPAHSPYTNEERPSNWFLILGDRAKGTILNIGTSNTFEPGTTKRIQFLPPPTVGHHSYTLFVLPDTYVGCDIEVGVNFKLAANPNPPPNAEEQQEQNQPPTAQGQDEQQQPQDQDGNKKGNRKQERERERERKKQEKKEMKKNK